MADDDVHRIELRAQTIEQLRSFLDGADLDLGCRPSVHRRSGELVVEVYATMSEINGLRTARSAAAVTVNVIENATEVGRSRQTEVGRQNRFATQQVPRGLGIKE